MEEQITLKDVKRFIENQNENILTQLRDNIEQQLQKFENTSAKKAAMRAMMKRKGKSAPTRSERLKALTAKKTTKKTGSDLSINEKIAALKNNSDNNNNNDRGNDEDGYITKILYISTDNWGDARVKLFDGKFKKAVMKTHKECKENKWYTPYGFGDNNDELKIKKFKHNKENDQIKTKLRLKKWDFTDKSNKRKIGYSCYVCN